MFTEWFGPKNMPWEIKKMLHPRFSLMFELLDTLSQEVAFLTFMLVLDLTWKEVKFH